MRSTPFGLSILTLALAFASGCPSKNDQPGPTDANVYEVNVELPPGCPPAQANEKGVGTPCTMGGGQCTGGLLCTCDRAFGVQLTGVPCVCTLVQLAQQGSTNPCGPPLASDFCGSNATCCSYLTSAAYCSPNVCLPGGQCIEFVPVDAGP